MQSILVTLIFFAYGIENNEKIIEFLILLSSGSKIDGILRTETWKSGLYYVYMV